jgi:hypothetical protein
VHGDKQQHRRGAQRVHRVDPAAAGLAFHEGGRVRD